MKNLKRFFIWWDSQTIGTQFFTWRKGKLVGTDDQGNRFYQDSSGSRRWVIYNGDAEASRVSPEWHGWLHHTFENPPNVEPFRARPWQRPHAPNLTGSQEAYRPPGSLRRAPTERRPYTAWRPDG